MPTFVMQITEVEQLSFGLARNVMSVTFEQWKRWAGCARQVAMPIASSLQLLIGTEIFRARVLLW